MRTLDIIEMETTIKDLQKRVEDLEKFIMMVESLGDREVNNSTSAV